MTTPSTGAPVAPIYKLPLEILVQFFTLLSNEDHYNDQLHLCHVCRSWLPSARAALYRFVTLSSSNRLELARTIKENESLVPLIRNVSLVHAENPLDSAFVTPIFQALSRHGTVLSLCIHDTFRIRLEFPEIRGLISSLRHLDVTVDIFDSLHEMKQFISSFPHLHSLAIHDDFTGDFVGEWYDETASEPHLDFPATIRKLAFLFTGTETLEALVQWVLHYRRTSDPIESLAFTILSDETEASLGTLLSSLGTELKFLRLDYRCLSSPCLPDIDLSANTNLHSLILDVGLFEQDIVYFKEHLSTTLATLSAPSLHSLVLELALNNPTAPHFHFIDWEVLDKSPGYADICVYILSREKFQTAGGAEQIIGQMPLHHAQGRIKCRVSSHRS
ncbi:hypothetical protein ONZ45_g19097 [Pleurotus djamor]|nr:hypothetical protein ONZ45_g19097 [Pleurotus djamor]